MDRTVETSTSDKYRLLILAGSIFSFAVLQLLSVWKEFSPVDSPDSFFLPLPEVNFLAATVIATLIIFVASLVIIIAVNHLRLSLLDRFLALFLLISLVNPLTFNGFVFFERTSIIALWEYSENLIAIIVICAILAALFASAWLKPRLIIKTFTVGLLLVLPYSASLVANAIWTVASYSPGEAGLKAKKTQLKSVLPEKRQRIVWIIFDELDRRAIFEAQLSNFNFPAFKRFAKESFAFTNAVQSNANTITAVPGMTTGRKVITSTPMGSKELNLNYSGDAKSVNWHETNSLFSELAKSGVKPAVLGWYFPYCRMFIPHLSKCRKIHLGMSHIADDDTFISHIWNRLISINPFHRRLKAVSAFNNFRRQAISMATDKEFDFVFLHIPLPHQPAIFDSQTAEFTALNFKRNGYLHNALIADALFNDIRHSMEEAGIWKQTTLMLSADHSWRKPITDDLQKHRNLIPLYVKFPNTSSGTTYSKTFYAERIKDLLLAVSNGALTKSSDLTEWANKNG